MVQSLFSPRGDGQCGFRTLAMALYGDQNKWIEVKEKMLLTFENYTAPFQRFRFENKQLFEKILSCHSSPCPPDMYFNFADCPQIAADTFGCNIAIRSVHRELSGELYYSDALFLPLIRLPSSSTVIHMFLYCFHFYLIDPIKTADGLPITTFPLPLVNPYHRPAIQRCPELVEFDTSYNFNVNH